MGNVNSTQKKRLFMLIGLPVLSLIILSVMGGYLAREEIRDRTIDGLESFASSQKDSVALTLKNYTTIHQGIASRTQLRSQLIDFNTTRSADSAGSINTILMDARSPFKDIKGIVLLDSRGTPITGIQSEAIPSSLHKELYESGSKKTTIRAIQTGEDSHTILHADSIRQGDTVIGVTIIAFSPEAFKAITHEAAGLGNTGETVLGYRSRDDVVLLPTRLQMSDKTVVIHDDRPLPIIPTLLNKQGSTFEDMTDYRGVKIVAATRYIEGADWAVVTKKDQNEVFKNLSTFTTIYIFITVMIISATIFLYFFLL